ncbi:MAG: helix-turn-helix domain-containing protein [Phototrophicaceae bacterium]
MIGKRLQWAREVQGHTQKSLAELLNMGEKQIWRYENEKTKPAGEDVARIAKALDVSTDYLLGITDDPLPHHHENLSPRESEVLAAMRRGDTMTAIRVLAGN